MKNLSSNLDNIDFSEINIEEYLGKEGIDLSIFDSLWFFLKIIRQRGDSS